MSQIIQRLDQQQLKSLCGVVAHTSEGLTKSELTTLLGQCGICAVDDGSSRNQLGYTIGLNKRDWLYNCLVTEINRSQSFSKVFSFLQAVLNPASYTSADSRQKYRYLFEETNKVLLFAGLSIDQSGRLVAVSQAETLSEVDQRVNHLKKALYDRAIHSEVQKYCVEDYLRADYYDAVFEAAKGLAERVRQISGLTTDGGTLFQTAFSKNDPYIFFNAMKTDSERSEFIGLKELLEAIFHLVRNPAAHTPKVNWKTDETKALDILTLLISFFLETHTLKKEIGCFADICQMWLDGCSFVEMHECTSLPIADLEDICSKSISYELSFFVGNIIDIIEINDEDIVNPLPNLLLLQRRLKYGVKTETAVSVCEKIFNDRFLANLLADKIGHDAIEANSIVGVMKSHKEDILDILSAYPTYFSERVQWICKD